MTPPQDEVWVRLTRAQAERFLEIVDNPDFPGYYVREAIRAALERNEQPWREMKRKIREYREALPDPGSLETLAVWFDMKYPNDPEPQVQQDLRKWAAKARKLLAEEV